MGKFFDNPKLPENTNTFQLFRYSNSNFSLATLLLSSRRISIESFTFVEEMSLKDKFFQHWFWFLIVWGLFQNVLPFLHHADIQTLSSRYFLAWFLLSRSQSKIKTLNRKIYLKSLILVPGLQLFIVRRFQKMLTAFISIFKLKYLTNYWFDFFPSSFQ